MKYETLFKLFDEKRFNIDDTSFYFKNDPQKIERFIGYVPGDERPYWIGRCDADGGCDFSTAKELFEAPVFDGRSLKDRWDDVELLTIGAVGIDEWSIDFCPPSR
ncbi:MAG: hypothetical protein K6G89_07725 [Clostridia bacterium]|nr:hypothetical protein [Clostridia bacterium]